MALKDPRAEQVGLTVTPCIERDGVITGYHARVGLAQLGATLLVFVEITLDHKSGNMFEQFRHEVIKIDEVLECHLVSGDFGYRINARIGEMADYRKLLGDILLQLPDAVQSKSYLVMEEIKETLDGRRAIVRNGHLAKRAIITAIGPVPVQAPKVRDRSGSGAKFNLNTVPPHVRKSPRASAGLPWLYLRGVSTGDMSEAFSDSAYCWANRLNGSRRTSWRG